MLQGGAVSEVAAHQDAHRKHAKRKQQKRGNQQQAATRRVASGANGVPVRHRKRQKMQHVV